MTLRATLNVDLEALLSSALDLSSAQVPLDLSAGFRFTDGAGANQANRIFTDQRTLAASATEDLDLAGSLADGLGATITFARIKGILVKAAAGNSNNVLVGGAASNQFISWVSDATDKVVVRPGGLLLLVAPDATGYAVTAATGDLLRVGNSGAGTSVTYDIVLIGAAT